MATSLLAGVVVTAFRWENATETYTNVGTDTTDANGEYSIGALWQGRSYKVKFDHPDYLVVYYGASGLQQDLETGGPVYMATNLTLPTVTLSLGGTIDGVVEGTDP
jgi:hypothetical protein